MSHGNQPEIWCLGCNHKTAPYDIREQIYVSLESLEKGIKPVQQLFGFSELLVISTCNRFEMYAVAPRGSCHGDMMLDAFFALQPNLQNKPREPWKTFTYCLSDREAWQHLMGVVSSLDSLVVGETQITGQFKDALKCASHAGTLGLILDRLSQESLGVTKKIRTHTAIGRKTVSISHAAIDLAKRVFGKIADHHVMLIGAGEIGEVAAQYAASHNPKSLTILNRSLEKARQLVEVIGMGEAHSLDQLASKLETVDIVLSSTASPVPLITKDFLAEIMRKRRNRPLFICDMAIPRDVSKDCGDLEDVYLFEIDDLQQVVKDNQAERQAWTEKAREIIGQGSLNFGNWLKRLDAQPVLGDFKTYLETLTAQEAQRTLGRQLFNTMTEEQKHAIRRMLDALVKKLAADAARAILITQAEQETQLLQALKTLFPLKSSSALPPEEMIPCPTPPQAQTLTLRP